MRYYEDNGGKGRRWGIIGIVLYLASCAAVMFITYRISLPETEEYILVELAEPTEEPQPEPESAAASSEAPSENPETAMGEAAPETAHNPAPDPTMTADDGEPVRTIDPRTLFVGSGTAGTATAPTENRSGSGNSAAAADGGVGGDYSLGGRGLGGSGRLPMPEYNRREEGSIIVDVTVDRQGVVVAAEYHAAGSTIPRGPLADAAVAAARRARFVVDENAPARQFGTITYTFRQTR
ncbi:MAG: TonB family protein [Alistipes sp.]|jgi:TonB family protein|nr:TonB family protein [Alistipes sp.]